MATTNTQATGVAYADPSFVSVQVGSSTVPVVVSSAGVLNGSYAQAAGTGGDTRLEYKRLTFTAAGSGETIRAYASITAASSASGGTINAIHASVGVDGGSVSGAANAIRATVGATTAAPGGTLSAIQADTNFDSGVTLPSSAAFIRFTESGTAKMANLFNLPKAMVAAKTSAAANYTIKIVADDGTAYYLLASAVQ